MEVQELNYKIKTIGIYKITNLINNKSYIGQSSNLYLRINKHINHFKNNTSPHPHLKRSVNKYGFNNFKIEILELCKKESLNEREQYYFDTLKPEYNALPIAGATRGFKWSKESKINFSKKKTGTKASEDTIKILKEKSHWKGKFGKNHNRSKEVIQLTKDDIEIQRFGSTIEAERITKISAKNIQFACKRQGTSANFKWRYKT